MSPMALFCMPPGAALHLRRGGATSTLNQRRARNTLHACAKASTDADERPLLLRAAAGEKVERAPVWLLRQAGRYMASFRAYSDRMPFRARSEDAAIARTLSLQPWQTFGTDAVILFSDILTPLPALGIDFDVIAGRGPVLPDSVRTLARAREVEAHAASFDPAASLPFIAEALGNLRMDVAGTDAALLGFVGAPFTLAAYSVEGGSAKHISHTKRLMLGSGADERGAMRVLLDAITSMVIDYAVYQFDSGAHAVQLFESWAHHLSPAQYRVAALPWVRAAAEGIKKRRPDAPVFFFANGAGGKLEMIKEELEGCVDVFALDWTVDMRDARRRMGNEVCLQGNVDPGVLLSGDEQAIRSAVRNCIAGARPGPHILNLGHGVVKETPEKSVKIFCEAAKDYSYEILDHFDVDHFASEELSSAVESSLAV